MIRNIHKAIIALLLIGLPSVSFAKRYDVTLPEVASCLKTAQPGDRIYIKDGQYKDMQLKWIGKGTEKSPITIEALNPGKVKVEGGSTLRIAGEWLSVSGLHFTDGYAPKGSVIEFRNGQELANHCRLTNCVIDKFNPSRRDQAYSYILLYGRHNRVDHCSLTGKLNLGVTLIVILNDERCLENHHRIDHNYFGERPVYGSNGAETMRVGTSQQAYSSSNTVIENNLFERCSGEVEVISIKSSDNIIRNNTLLECEGVVALRHGDRNTVNDNLFIGNGRRNTGGIRVVNAGHQIYDNVLVGLAGTRFFSALGVMDAVPNSLPNRYCQVVDVCEIDISHGDTIPSLINIVVLAEMRTPLTEKGENQLEAYLARGGNLFILTDTGRQEVMNPFLSKLGIKMEEYQLAQSSADFSPNLILAKATRESEKLTFGFKDDFPKYDLRVSMPGCVALTCSDNDYGFQYTPILETNAKGVWIEKEQTDLQESPVECNASAGEKEQTYITAYALSRQLKDKEQRIIISGDADCISNTELTLSREGYRSGNFNLIIESFRWLSGGEFPIDIRRPHCTDNKLSIGVKDIGTMKTIFIIIIPAILLLIGVGIWFFRRRN